MWPGLKKILPPSLFRSGRRRARLFFFSLSPSQNTATTGCFDLCGGRRTKGGSGPSGRDDTPAPQRTVSPSPEARVNGGTPAPPPLGRTESAGPALHPAGVGSSGAGGGAGSSAGSGHARIGSGVDLHTLLSHVLPSKEAAIKVPPVATGGEARCEKKGRRG